MMSCFRSCVIRNSMKCFSNKVFSNIRRHDNCVNCFYKNNFNCQRNFKRHSSLGPYKFIHVPNFLCNHIGVAFPRRFQSYQLSFDEQKLEQFLRNLSWEQLQARDSMQFIHKNVVLNLLQNKDKLEGNIKELESIKEKEEKKENNREMVELIEDDIAQFKAELTEIYEKIIDIVVPRGEFEDCNDILLEISAGVGGSEAQLFASNLRNMYLGFLENKGWECQVADNDESELGGVRHCSLLVSAPGAYSTLQHEAGVHRVQRVPETEKGGRMHTSTVTVAVLPQPSEVEVDLKDSDLRIETKRASGAGGQHVNTTDSAVRIAHLPSGIIVECQTDRSQFKNKQTALKKLKAKLYERELNKVDSLQRSQRKSQVGSSARSEKIRTYNFRDDRISDHRLSGNLHNMKDFLQGGEQFEKLLEQLIQRHHESKIKEFIDSLPD